MPKVSMLSRDGLSIGATYVMFMKPFRLCCLYPINCIINMSCHVMLQSYHGFDWFIMNYFCDLTAVKS